MFHYTLYVAGDVDAIIASRVWSCL